MKRPLKVKQLIKQLEKLNPELSVIVSSDGEGNSYSPFHEIVAGGLLYDFKNDQLYDESEEDIPKKAKPVAVIYPV